MSYIYNIYIYMSYSSHVVTWGSSWHILAHGVKDFTWHVTSGHPCGLCGPGQGGVPFSCSR